ncbi:MAG: hypothetical protein HWD92_07055 [Flavobacteriia bacterium]|nr:hypothetical protein [Flavobacteriia bacterium]
MQISTSLSLNEVLEVLNRSIEESLIVPSLKGQRKKEVLFFGSKKGHTFKIYTQPEYPEIKGVRPGVRLKVEDSGAKRILYYELIRYSKTGLYLIYAALAVALIALLFWSNTILAIGAPLMVFGVGINIVTYLGYVFGGVEALKRMDTLKKRIRNKEMIQPQ